MYVYASTFAEWRTWLTSPKEVPKRTLPGQLKRTGSKKRIQQCVCCSYPKFRGVFLKLQLYVNSRCRGTTIVSSSPSAVGCANSLLRVEDDRTSTKEVADFKCTRPRSDLANIAKRSPKKKTARPIEPHRFKSPPSPRLLRKSSRAGGQAGADTEILRVLAT